MDIAVWVSVLTIGTIGGSFLNVLVYRLPRRLDFVRGPSLCPSCGHRLGPLDLVPILSWLALGRKCRHCKASIPLRYPLVEMAGGVLALVCWLAFVPDVDVLLGLDATAPTGQPLPLLRANTAFLGAGATVPAALLYFCMLCILLAVACIDAETMEIPDGLNVAVLVCGLAALVVAPEVPLLGRVVGLLCVSVPLLAITLIVPGAFGGGDIKLMAAAGFLLGWQGTLLAAFVGIVIGGGYGIYLMISGRKGRTEHFAFGPALCAGIAFSMFFGIPTVNWYLGLL